MIDALFSSSNYVATKKMLDATALRAEAISSNIANISRPGYKRIDLAPGFESQMQAAVQNGDAESVASLKPTLAVDDNAVASQRDGNTVELEDEMLAMSENSMAHATETQLLTGAMLRLRLAITGRPS